MAAREAVTAVGADSAAAMHSPPMLSPFERFARAALVVLGLITVVLAFGASALRGIYGFPDVVAHIFVVGGLGLILVGSSWSISWQRCSALIVLGMFGQACALQLTFAPAYDIYQHFVPWSETLSPARLPFLLGIVAQTVIVAWAAVPHWPSIRQGAVRLLRPMEAGALSALLGFGAVVVSANPQHFAWELLLTAWIALIGALTLVLAALSLPQSVVTGAAAKLGQLSGTPSASGWFTRMDRRFPWIVAAWTTIVAAALAWFVLDAVPHIPDDVSYLFQAKYFASGRLYLPAPPDLTSFQVGQVAIDGGKWFGYGFPGWPALLAVGVIAGAPWLVNPLLAGAVVLFLHTLLVRLYGRGTAHAAVALLAVSPWFIYMSATFMTHTATIFWAVLALLAIEKERTVRKGYWGSLAGLSLGALFLTRPLEGILVGGVAGLWALGAGARRLSARGITGMILPGILLASLIFPYSALLTGNPLHPPQQKWTDLAWYPGADRLGFGSEIGNVGWTHLDPLPGHGPLDVLINANRNVYMSGVELFGWTFGSLTLVFFAVVTRRIRRADWIFAGIALATIAGHSFYWFGGGPDLGARYWYQALIPFVILTIRGVEIVRERLRAGAANPSGAFGYRPILFIAIACLVAFPNLMTWRTFGKYHRYRGMSADVRELAERKSFGRDLVFVRARDRTDYSAAFILNPAMLDGPGPVYARDLGPAQRAALSAAFPGRRVWIIGYPTAQRDEMKVLAGPFTPE